MPNQVVDAAMARALHADACRDHALAAWIVMRDAPGYPDQVIARLATKRLLPQGLRMRFRSPARC
jgi:protein gp37